jgi:hypothetical protein
VTGQWLIQGHDDLQSGTAVTTDPAREPAPIWVSRALEHRLLPGCVGDAITRLMAEFGDRVDGNTVASIVIGAYRDLQGTADASLPEFVERCARQRILAEQRSHPRRN